jgi:hypothetical protein
VNGGGGSRLNPGASHFAAYWMGRLLAASGGDDNLSPHARDPLPWSPPVRPDAGPRPVDAGPTATPPGTSTCGCRAGTSRPSLFVVGLAVAVLCVTRRRRA